ncbi:ketoacyl-ACP synthase III [Azospirillum halopraeferens]|uniref:ketoacyl-ACP synthase III n=1 Tax=Azospirillum halopraeferens TaxID=34010 RepID=UPI0004163996|nr:ketoacyl-ACP synthase III [Azospirillum halopraeferens]
MVASVIEGVRFAGVVSCVPERRETTDDLAARFGEDTARRIAAATGITARHVVPPHQCTSDLALAAARHLLDRLGWEAGSVDLLILVSQTHDHILPGTGFLLHRALGLGKGAAVFDMGLGCSGYVYGLWTASALLRAAGGRRALLLAGDTTSRLVEPGDRAVAPLFGDAAAATALEADAAAPPMAFALGTDGAGAPYLMVPGGAMRRPDTPAHLTMDGTQVFAFTLREVPGNVRTVLDLAGWSVQDVDRVVLHQANAQMIRHLAAKIGATPAQTVLALAGYGNTSSASIPLALTQELAAPPGGGSLRLLLSGFGVGWSWGSATVTAGPLAACATLVLDADGRAAVSADPATDAGGEALSAGCPAKFA